MPIDGSTAGEPVQYLTRGNFAGTFPVSATPNRGGGNVVKANGYVYDGYDAKYTEFPVTDTVTTEDGKRLLIWMREDGSQPTKADLDGTSGAELVLNEQLVEKLGRNYKAPEYEKLLDQITRDELLNLVECSGYGNDAIVSIGKANNRDYDGPSGLRPLDGTLSGMQAAVWSGYPGQMNVAQTYNKALAFQVGRAIGNETIVTGLSGWYAPAVNLHRTPYNGRYFEYYSEDGVLSGDLAAYVIKGAASVNVYCYMKHLALSEMGINPINLNVWLTEQAFRETYLRPFEIAVKEGGANGIMTAFNRIGGTWAGGCKAMNVDILRTEWGFRGVLITDWSTGDSYMNPTQGIRAGNDMWLNPNDVSGKPLERNNTANINLARNSAHNMLYTICNTYVRYKDYDPADGEFVASVGVRSVNKVFAWWIPVLVALNVIVFGIIIFETTWIFVKGRKRYLSMQAAAAAGVEYVEPTRKNSIKKKKPKKTAPPPVELLEPDEETAQTENASGSENAVAAQETEPENASMRNDTESAALREQVAALTAELSGLTEYIEKLKEADEQKRIAAEKRRVANRNKPKKPKAPSQQQQIADMQKEIDELKEIILKLRAYE